MKQLRYLFRKLSQSPTFSVVSILTLAIGIGANTAVFSVVNGVLIKPLPYEDPDRLIGVWHTAPGMGWDEVVQSPALYFTYRDHSELMVDNGMWAGTQVSITGLQDPEQVSAMRVTDGVFPILGVSVYLGRVFTLEDDSPDTPMTAILSHSYWQERFAGDPGVIGEPLIVNGEQREIIGVMPPDLRFMNRDWAIYLPFRFDRGEVFFDNFSYQGVARLKEGVTLEQANDEVARMAPLALEIFPMPPGFSREMLEQVGFGPNLRPLKRDVVGDVGDMLWVLLGTVGMVLLIACANVANLFLVRAEGRQQELAVRAALGAGRGRLARELLGESVALGLLGGAVGLGLAAAGVRLLVRLSPRGLPRLNEIGIDAGVLLFTLATAVLAGAVFGLFPVAKLGAANLVNALKEGGRGGSAGRDRHRVRNALVVSQVALALVLLVGSGLMVRSLQALRDVDPGFRDPEQVLTVRLTVPNGEVEDPLEVTQLHEQVLNGLRQLPGVEAAAMSSSLTMDGNTSMDPIWVEEFLGDPNEVPPLRRFKWVAPDYFSTVGNPLSAGRDFSWDEIWDASPVLIMTENLAREYWDNPADAIGKRVRHSPEAGWREIVGVVGDIYDDGVSQGPVPTVFWPMQQRDFWGEGLRTARSMAFAIRSPRVGSPGLLDEVRATIWSVNANLPLANVRTLEEILDRSMARTSFTLTMLGIASIAAMLLGSVGIYGVTSYIVSQRTREMGVRMALGAQVRDISRLVLRQGLVLAGVGVVIGVVAAFGLTRLMAALLYGVSPMDPVTLIAVSAGVASVALVASYVPARRAAGVNPVEALRFK